MCFLGSYFVLCNDDYLTIGYKPSFNLYICFLNNKKGVASLRNNLLGWLVQTSLVLCCHYGVTERRLRKIHNASLGCGFPIPYQFH